MKFKAGQNGRQTGKGAREMAAAAEIVHGTPINMEFGETFVDLGAEQRDGQQVIVLAVDDGDVFTTLKLSPEQAELLADVLLGLAHLGSCG
jgi:hypothetical protein